MNNTKLASEWEVGNFRACMTSEKYGDGITLNMTFSKKAKFTDKEFFAAMERFMDTVSALYNEGVF